MAVKITKYESHDESVKTELLISTIERNRDRIRTISNMLLTMSGILIPACVAFVLFTAENEIVSPKVTITFAIAAIWFLGAACLSIVASFLRTRYTILTEVQFVSDLLRLFYSELRLLRLSFVAILGGLLTITSGIVIFVLTTWRS